MSGLSRERAANLLLELSFSQAAEDARADAALAIDEEGLWKA
jgi:hypothetical protein